MTQRFDHEKLRVYQESLKFIVLVRDLCERIPKRMAAYDQLDRASTSIALNIAEGNGKFTQKDRCRFFDIARGSALECAACLDVLAAKDVLNEQKVGKTKERLVGIVSMLVGLIKSNSSSRAYEAPAEYQLGC